MTRRLAFTPLASADIENAFDWYLRQRHGLGEEFGAALELVWQLLAAFPESGPVVHRELRRVLVPRFPYAVYYLVLDSTIEVRGCLHQRRDPRTSRRRA